MSGPTRTDLLVVHTETEQRRVCAQRGAKGPPDFDPAVAGAYATGRERNHSILLFDEVAAHLDQRRREALYDELVALNCQAWLTGTDRALLHPSAQERSFLACLTANCFRITPRLECIENV